MSTTQQPDPRNSGHGHVVPRPDGMRARCGGPGLCKVCQHDRALLESRVTQQPELSAPASLDPIEDLMTKVQAFGLACWTREDKELQITMQDEIRSDIASLAQAAVLADRERRGNPRQLIERWKGDDKIESPFNACQHKGYCLGLKGGLEKRAPLSDVTDSMLQAAMKEAVKVGLVPKFCIGEDEYLKQWKAVESVLKVAIGAAPSKLEDSHG